MKRSFSLLYIASVAATLFGVLSCSPRDQGEQNAVLSIQAFTDVDPSVKSQVAGFLTDYFALNQTLIEDDFAGAKLAASSFAQTANNFNISKLNPGQLDFYLIHSSSLKTGLQDLSESADIDEARVELANISSAMYAMVKAFHPHDAPVYYQYCPMARDNQGATWLSASKELMNPYMGQMMLACGRTQETIE